MTVAPSSGPRPPAHCSWLTPAPPPSLARACSLHICRRTRRRRRQRTRRRRRRRRRTRSPQWRIRRPWQQRARAQEQLRREEAKEQAEADPAGAFALAAKAQSGPSYSYLATAAILAMDGTILTTDGIVPGCSSVMSIMKWIQTEYPYPRIVFKKHLLGAALKKGAASGAFVKVKASYKVSAAEKERIAAAGGLPSGWPAPASWAPGAAAPAQAVDERPTATPHSHASAVGDLGVAELVGLREQWAHTIARCSQHRADTDQLAERARPLQAHDEVLNAQIAVLKAQLEAKLRPLQAQLEAQLRPLRAQLEANADKAKVNEEELRAVCRSVAEEEDGMRSVLDSLGRSAMTPALLRTSGWQTGCEQSPRSFADDIDLGASADIRTSALALFKRFSTPAPADSVGFGALAESLGLGPRLELDDLTRHARKSMNIANLPTDVNSEEYDECVSNEEEDWVAFGCCAPSAWRSAMKSADPREAVLQLLVTHCKGNGWRWAELLRLYRVRPSFPVENQDVCAHLALSVAHDTRLLVAMASTCRSWCDAARRVPGYGRAIRAVGAEHAMLALAQAHIDAALRAQVPRQPSSSGWCRGSEVVGAFRHLHGTNSIRCNRTGATPQIPSVLSFERCSQYVQRNRENCNSLEGARTVSKNSVRVLKVFTSGCNDLMLGGQCREVSTVFAGFVTRDVMWRELWHRSCGQENCGSRLSKATRLDAYGDTEGDCPELHERCLSPGCNARVFCSRDSKGAARNGCDGCKHAVGLLRALAVRDVVVNSDALMSEAEDWRLHYDGHRINAHHIDVRCCTNGHVVGSGMIELDWEGYDGEGKWRISREEDDEGYSCSDDDCY